MRCTLTLIGSLCLAVVLCTTPAFAEELTVSAAASLTNAFTEIKTLFEKKYPDAAVSTNFAASNPLLQQIRQGAPADVFASADQETMDTAQNEKLIDPASRKDFARNSLVLIVPVGGKVKSLKDLTVDLRIAAGNPDSVPAGRYARDSLTAAGLYERLKPAIIHGNSVRQVLDYVARGEADAGFVYATDAAVLKDKVNIVGTMGGHKPVLYPAAVIAASGRKKLAQSFVDFLFTPEAGAVLQKYGFSKP